MEDANVSFLFEKVLKEGNINLYNKNPCLVTFNLKSLLTRKLMIFLKGFYDIPIKNGGMSK